MGWAVGLHVQRVLLSEGLATLAFTVRKQFFLNVSTCGVFLVEVHVNTSDCNSCGVLAEKCEKTLSMFSSNSYIASQEERFSAGSAKQQQLCYLPQKGGIPVTPGLVFWASLILLK